MNSIYTLFIIFAQLLLLPYAQAQETAISPQSPEQEAIAQPKEQPAAPPVGRLIIEVTGLKKQKGELICRIYNSEENFPSKDEAKMFRFLKLPVEGETATFTVDQVPLGEYGIILHHDLNSNGKMDRHWYGPPKEPVGCSNDAKGSFGPPKWRDAVIELNTQELIVPININ